MEKARTLQTPQRIAGRPGEFSQRTVLTGPRKRGELAEFRNTGSLVMTRSTPVLVALLVLARSAEARSIVQEITPADAERFGWEIQVRADGDLLRFTVCLGHKDRLLK